LKKNDFGRFSWDSSEGGLFEVSGRGLPESSRRALQKSPRSILEAFSRSWSGSTPRLLREGFWKPLARRLAKLVSQSLPEVFWKPSPEVSAKVASGL